MKNFNIIKTLYICIIKITKKIYKNVKDAFFIFLYYLFRFFPLQNKIIASTFQGRKYGDNPQFILEELFKIAPDLDYVWLKNKECVYTTPTFLRTVNCLHNPIRQIYEYATAKVWIDTHRLDSRKRKRKGQLFIETWHGGLGIKKLDGDVEKFRQDKRVMAEVYNTSKLADLFISNSDHLTNIYRSAFGYKGKIWKCGYPKNDSLIFDGAVARKNVRSCYNLSSETKIIIYAPTFRDELWNGKIDISLYDMDFRKVYYSINKYWDGKWQLFIRWHPNMMNLMTDIQKLYNDCIIDVTDYPDMQELILASDAFISDYSSCIFDAAIRNIPCFTFATDFEEYKVDRGVYYEMEELPFPYAKNNDELIYNIINFNYENYLENWEKFKIRTGLYESGHAAKDIAYVINEFVKGNTKPLEDIQNEE